MTAPAVTTDTTTPTAADAAVAASTTETDKGVVVRTESMGQLAWHPPATKEDYDKAISDAVQAAIPKAPEKYEGLKLPDKVAVDPALVERTAAIARTLGLPQDKAQSLVDSVASEVATQTAAALAQYSPPSEENKEGGAKWREQDTAWKQAALVDKELGNGKPEQLQANVELAKKVLAKYGDEESIGFIDSALGSNPPLLRVLVRIGKAASEGSLVRQEGDKPEEAKPTKDVMYPHGANLPEGDPRLNQP